MRIANKFNVFLAIYFIYNALFILLLLAEAKFVLNKVHTLFFLFVLFGLPVVNTLVSLIIKLNYKAYSWYFFIGTVFSMTATFLVNATIFLDLVGGA